jgi:citronellol/citronellal dehydrogenase
LPGQGWAGEAVSDRLTDKFIHLYVVDNGVTGTSTPPLPYRSPLRSDANAGRVALVSGGGTGIGRATALEMAGSGARVVVCGRRAEPLERVRGEIEQLGGEALAVAADLREADEARRVTAAALARFGHVDVLVNNAGGQFSAPAEEISDNGWRAVHRITVDAVWSLTREVATQSMIPRGGGLVVFVGFSPLRGIPGFAHACAGRAAVANLAGGLALEWSRHGIRSVCVAPGTILTEGLEGYGPEAIETWRRSVPLGRLGRPEEIGALVAFLASPGGAYVTGTTIVVDGGADAWGQAEPPPPVEAPAP